MGQLNTSHEFLQWMYDREKAVPNKEKQTPLPEVEQHWFTMLCKAQQSGSVFYKALIEIAKEELRK